MADLLTDPLLSPTGALSSGGGLGGGGLGGRRSLEPEEQGLDLWRLYGILLKWLWLVGTVVAICFISVAYWSFRQVRIYRADASVVIDLTPPQVLKGMHEVVDLGSGNFWSTQEYFGTQYRIIKSRAVAEKVIARLGLDQDDDYLGIPPNLDPKTRVELLRGRSPVERVMNSIQITPVKDSRVVVISVEDANPQRAADLVNAIAEEYIEQNVDRKLVTTQGASAWLAQQIAIAKKSLEDSDKALIAFRERNDVLSTSMEARQNISAERLIEVSSTLNKTAIKRLELESRRQALARIIAESKDSVFTADSFGGVAESATVGELKREYFRLKNERAELVERYLPDHPKVKSLDERIKRTRDDVAYETGVILRATENEYLEVLDTEKRLQGALAVSKEQAFETSKLEIEHDRYKREKERSQQLFDVMVRRQKEVEVSGLLRTNNIRMLDAAQPPRTPVRPNRTENLLVALLVGLALGCALAVLLEALDNTIKSQDDVEVGLGLPLLGILPSIPDIVAADVSPDNTLQRDLYIAANPKSSIAECARAIRTSLLFSSPDKPFKVLLIASCGPREGKTTTLISIGITMAQSGNRVLLIDGDLRRPRLHRTFNTSSQAGFSTPILGESTPEQAIKTTGIERLFVMPAGPVPPNPSEILQSARYAEVIKELSTRYDRIIIDSPPVGVVTDALIMAAQADGLVLVLRAGSTPKKAARRGKRTLQDVKAHIYGAVLNDVELASRVGQYYRYYNYYRYGYYQDSQYGYGGTDANADANNTTEAGSGGPLAGADEPSKKSRKNGSRATS